MTSEQKNYSITGRLTLVMLLIAFFFVAIAVVQFTANRGYVSGLTKINTINLAINLCSQSLEALNDSGNVLTEMEEKKFTGKKLDYFEENQKVIRDSLIRTIGLPGISEGTKDIIRESLHSLTRFEGSVALLFQQYQTREKDQSLETEILIARQFSNDAREYLRKAQIDLREDSDKLARQLYSDRFLPSMIVIALSMLFFVFVITIGFRVTTRIRLSVRNLAGATDRVTLGDYHFQAPILNHDEFGVLTSRFNTMTTSIQQGKDELTKNIERVHSLQTLAERLAEALRPNEAMEIAIEEGMKALKATSGSFLTLNSDGSFLELAASQGLDVEILRKWQVIPMSLDVPITESIRRNQAIFFENHEQFQKSYPTFFRDFSELRLEASAMLPLSVGKKDLGAIAFSFDTPREFGQEDKDFAVAVARQVAQALFRTQLYEKSQQAIQARDEFLSIASHELKTPLTPLKLQLQMLSRNLNSDKGLDKAKIEKTLKDSDLHFNRLSKLILNLLDISRISSGKLILSPELVSVNGLIRDLIVQLHDQLELNKVQVTFKENEEVQAVIDPVRFEQVVVNLISNALKYAPEKPLRIELTKNQLNFQVKVIDAGPGIERKDFGRIFQKFERISSVDNVGGLGLGLYITKQIVESHKGNIWVESELGKGATFICELPLRTIS